MKARSFAEDPTTAALAAPARGPAMPIEYGMLMGLNEDTGALLYLHPWELRRLKIVGSLVWMLLGLKGFGKSAYSKIFALRGGLFAMSGGVPPLIWIGDHKPEGKEALGEFAEVGKFYGAKRLKMSEQQINPLYMGKNGEILDPTDVLILATSIYEAVTGLRLTPDQAFMLMVAVHHITKTENILRGQTGPGLLELQLRKFDWEDVDSFYGMHQNNLLESIKKNLRDEHMHKVKSGAATTDTESRNLISELQLRLDRPYSMDIGYLTEISQGLSRVFALLKEGPTKGVFGDTHSLHYDNEGFNDRVIISDWSDMNDFETKIARAVQYQIDTRAMATMRMEGIPHVAIEDEIQDSMLEPFFVRILDTFAAKSRSVPTFRLMNSQHFGGFLQGGVGSPEYNMGLRIIKNTGAFIFARMDPGEDTIAMIRQQTGMSLRDTRRTTTHDVGHYTLFIPGPRRIPPIHFEMVVTEQELAMIPTDSAVDDELHLIPVLQNDGVIRRLNRISGKMEEIVPTGIEMIGG